MCFVGPTNPIALRNALMNLWETRSASEDKDLKKKTFRWGRNGRYAVDTPPEGAGFSVCDEESLATGWATLHETGCCEELRMNHVVHKREIDNVSSISDHVSDVTGSDRAQTMENRKKNME